MADKESGGKESPSARRMRQLRRVQNFSTARAFGAWLGLTEQQYNNFENGLPVSKGAAEKMVAKIPGLTYDWLFTGKMDGLPVQLARELAPESTGNATTVPSA